MRIRSKPWAKEELNSCYFFEKEPEKYKENWKEKFNNNNPIHIELGCGKGIFVAKIAKAHPEINFIAIDIKMDILGVAKRNIEKLFDKKIVSNVVLVQKNIEQINDIISGNDNIERIYINFCNPWPRGKHQKRRLTHTRLLLKYKQFLKSGVEIYFKTDDEDLYNSSFRYFKEADYKIIRYTNDLHRDNIFTENFTTEHEEMYTKEGIKIKAIIAKV